MTIDPVYLIGDRVCLREMTEADALNIVAWRNDPEIRKWMFNQDVLTLESHLRWFRRSKSDRVDYVICERENHQPIGTVNYTNIGKNEGEAGKMLGDKTYWGRGFAKEAFLLWLRIGFTVFGFKRIYIRTIADNAANIILNQKIGFEISGETKMEIDGNLTVNVLTMELSRENFHER